MGEMYRSTDDNWAATRHSKCCRPKWYSIRNGSRAFRREPKALAQLDHPNIVTIYSVEESDGIHLLTMQLARQKG